MEESTMTTPSLVSDAGSGVQLADPSQKRDSISAAVAELLAGYPDSYLALLDGDELTAAFRTAINTQFAAKIVQAAIDEVGFIVGTYIDLPLDQWPLGEGSQDDVEEIHPNRVITNRELLQRLDDDKKDFVLPLDLLRRVKNQKPEYPVGILFYIGDQLWYLYVRINGDGDLELDVCQEELDDYWDGDVRFLVRSRK
jgi:hypothetical protein